MQLRHVGHRMMEFGAILPAAALRMKLSGQAGLPLSVWVAA
jgi:hypothetical protein